MYLVHGIPTELGKIQEDSWVFRLNQLGENWKKYYIKPYSKGKGLCIMIWAAIRAGPRSFRDHLCRARF
jgi:hypothetical protein